jgi:hypothetical protein
MITFLPASDLPEPGTFLGVRRHWRDRPGTCVPTKRDVMYILAETHDFLLSIGSAWEAVPTCLRWPALEQAHKLEDLQLRNVTQSQKDSDETWRRRRRMQMRHHDTDLNALGGPRGTG